MRKKNKLHGRKFVDEFDSNFLEMGKNLARSFDDAGLVILESVLRAELFGENGNFVEVVARSGREEMVFDLVIKASAEPVGQSERILSDVARGGDLEFPEIGSLGRIVDFHAVVSEGEDDGESETAGDVGDEDEPESVEKGGVHRCDGKVPSVVKPEKAELEFFVTYGLELSRSSLHLATGGFVEVQNVCDGLFEPREASKG